MERFLAVIGIALIIGVVFATSVDRRRVNWRTVLCGFGIQFLIGWLLLSVEATRVPFSWFADKAAFFLNLGLEGAGFVFGDLINIEKFGFIFAFRVLPTIIFFSAFISLMYYLGVVQFVIKLIAGFMRKTMKTSGSETLCGAANIFVGQTEAPLLIKPYLAGLTYSEICAMMVAGFATISGGVLAAYVGMGISAEHLIIGSVMAAPGALALAKLSVPETEHSATAGDTPLPSVEAGDNALDAVSRGTSDGLGLAINVAAMLIAFISLIAVLNWILGGADALIDGKWLGGAQIPVGAGFEYSGFVPGSLRTILGYLFYPVAILMGVPRADAINVADLVGTKICLNEFVGYFQLAELMKTGAISERAASIVTYAMCGFANISSIGIQIGGIGVLAPTRRAELARLGVRAMLIGASVSIMNACIAGLLLP